MSLFKIQNVVILIILGLVCSLNADKLGARLGWVERAGAGSIQQNMGGTGLSNSKAQLPAFINPAIVGVQRKTQVSVGGETRSLDRRGGHLGFNSTYENHLAFGYAVLYRGDAGIELIDENDQNIGVASPGFLRHSVALSARRSQVESFGVSLDWSSFHPDVEGFQSYSSPISFTVGYYRSFDNIRVGTVLRNLGFNGNLSAEEIASFENGGAAVDTKEDYYPKALELEISHDFGAGTYYVKNSSYLLQNGLWGWDTSVWENRLGLGLELPFWADYAIQMGYKGKYFSTEGGVPGNLSLGLSWRMLIAEEDWVEWTMGAIAERKYQYTPIHLSMRMFF